jgi:hypothetical protein
VDDFSYQAFVRLGQVAGVNWYALDGALAGKGIDPSSLSPRRLLAFVRTWVIEHIDPEKVEQWLAELDSPLPGTEPDKVSASTVQDEMDAFNAFSIEAKGG